MIIRFPEKFRKMAPGKPGSISDRLVSFVDFAPTILSLASIKPPEYMQGKSFLGKYKTKHEDYVFMFRGRMDERYDMSRTVRSQQYRYIRNYMPDRIYGQHLNYLWRAPSCRSWEKAYLNGECNEIQSRFWNAKPPEELYDTSLDPWEVNNLVNNPGYKKVLESMRKACNNYILDIHDSGFIPEPELSEIAKKTALADYTQTKNYPLKEILDLANKAILQNPGNTPLFLEKLNDTNSVIRYWAIYGIKLLGEQDEKCISVVRKALNDPSDVIKLTAAEILCYSANPEDGIKILKNVLKNQNDLVKLWDINIITNLPPKKRILFQENINSLLAGSDPKSRAYYLRAARYLKEDIFDN
jgi:hypothetical protein